MCFSAQPNLPPWIGENGAVISRCPQEIMEEIAALDAEAAEVLGRIRGLL